jgi:RNA polymerase sigma factor (sigma-70 family)
VSVADDQPFVKLREEEIVRQFRAAKDRGDEDEAWRCWQKLVELNFDRVLGFVKAESHGRLNHREREDALDNALDRILHQLIHSFRGTSIGEWRCAVRSAVRFACLDAQEAAVDRSSKETSLQAAEGVSGGGDERQSMHPELTEALLDHHAERESREEDAAVLADGRAFFEWALPQLPKRERDVIWLDSLGVPVPEIQQRLGISRDNVYTSRHRALKSLAKLRERYES